MLERIRSINIISIAEELGLRIRRNTCLCPFHDDHHPSLVFWPAKNIWKCYGCGEKGDSIALVMKKEDLSFTEACQWIADRYGICYENENILRNKPTSNKMRRNTTQPMRHILASRNTALSTLDKSLVTLCRGTGNSFCRSIVSTAILTKEQMLHAAERYRLGCTKDGGVVFWQIDENGNIRDGKIMFYDDNGHRNHDRPPSWASYRLKKKKEVDDGWSRTSCLFGLHLIREHPSHTDTSDRKGIIVAVVESEKTAVIFSELFPSLNDVPIAWMATGGVSNLSPELLLPLKGHRIIIFPDTDVTGDTFRKWQDKAKEASTILQQPLYVSRLLEEFATKEQKEKKIDIVDFL